MKILAFDTSSIACSVALLNGDSVKVLHQIAPMQQARLILPMIQELLDACSLKLNNLDALAYGCGPGSFTGIRIASSVVQGIGFVTSLPIIKVSSMAAMAQAAFLEHRWVNLLVCLDARVGQVYWAIYKIDSSGRATLCGEEQICAPEEVKKVANEDWYGIGDGWEKYGEQIRKRLNFQPQVIHSSQLPTAEAMLYLAKSAVLKGDWVTVSNATPTYLR